MLGVYNTEYRTGLNLIEGAQPQAIDPYDESLTGNVTSRFTLRQMAS